MSTQMFMKSELEQLERQLNAVVETKRKKLVEILLAESLRTGCSLRTVMVELIDVTNYPPPNETAIHIPPVNKAKDAANHVMVDAVVRNKGNIRRAAFELGMPKSTLHDHISRLKRKGMTLERLP